MVNDNPPNDELYLVKLSGGGTMVVSVQGVADLLTEVKGIVASAPKLCKYDFCNDDVVNLDSCMCKLRSILNS